MAATVKTRIQLKYDTEANWNKAINFIPLKGEVIIYSADDSHPFCRLKVGDGGTRLANLPFVFFDDDDEMPSDLNFVLREHYTDFPPTGQTGILYLEAATDTVYIWTNAGGYTPKYGIKKQTINNVINWDPGVMTTLSVKDKTGILTVENGTIPALLLEDVEIVNGFDLL